MELAQNLSYPITVSVPKQHIFTGRRLYDLQKDPYELKNLLPENGENTPKKYQVIVKEMMNFMKQEIKAGFQYPIIPSPDVSGKLMQSISSKMYVLLGKTRQFYVQTKRVIQDSTDSEKSFGTVGRDWCPPGLESDREIFTNLWQVAIEKNQTQLAKDAELLLTKSRLFGGK